MHIQDLLRSAWGRVGVRRAATGGLVAAALVAAQVLPVAAAAATTVSTTSGTSTSVGDLISQLSGLENQINSITNFKPSTQSSVTNSVYGTAPSVATPQMQYPTAPASFGTYLQALVGSMEKVAQEVPMAAGPQTLAALQQYGADLADLSQSTLNQVYFYMSQDSNWQNYPSILSAAVGEISSKAPALGTQFTAWVAANAPQDLPLLGGTSSSTGTGSISSSVLAPSGPSSPTTTSGGDAFPPIPPDTCPPIVPYPGMPLLLHGLDLVETGLDKGAKLAERDDTDGAIVLGEGVVITIPGIVHDILEVAAFVVKAASLAATILDELNLECETDAHQELLKTLYENLSRTQGTVIGNTDTLIVDVTALTAIVNARTSTIIQNIGYLRQQVNNQVNTILNSQSALINVVNNQTLQNEQNQQTANMVNNRQLTVQIENSLSTSLEENDALFELPQSVGGYLDATPVGVQSVVTNLVVAMQQSGQAIAPEALLALSLADRALTMNKYKLAYLLYKIAYQILQYVGPLGPPFGSRFGIPNGAFNGPPFNLPNQASSTSQAASTGSTS